jgi:hypothetical protein
LSQILEEDQRCDWAFGQCTFHAGDTEPNSPVGVLPASDDDDEDTHSDTESSNSSD